MKKIKLILLVALLIGLAQQGATAQNRLAQGWTNGTEPFTTLQRVIQPLHYRNIDINVAAMQGILSAANATDRANAAIFTLPMPDGSTEQFRIWENSCMHPDLQKTYPNIRVYTGQGVQHPEATLTIDVSPYGFHAMARFADEIVFIDPFAHLDIEHYIVYNKSDFRSSKRRECAVGDAANIDKHDANTPVTHSGTEPLDLQKSIAAPQGNTTGPTLRTYRLAMSATAEYSLFHSPSQIRAQVLAAIVTSVARVNSVYERDIAVHFNLVKNDSLLIFFNPNTDGFTNNSGGALLGENQAKVTAIIGAANYDIGHVFSTGGGGVATLGCVCGNSKAQGVTGSASPVGDPFDIDYVVHEIGHQFGCNHTFNGNQGSCGGNGNPGTAVEPGSGVTIMAYAGICGTDDIDTHSIDIFHTQSFDEATAFSQILNGNSCALKLPSGNTTPTVSVSPITFVIPKATPFSLTGSGADADGDAITFCWESMDKGTAGAPDITVSNSKPQFRSFNPTTSPTRYFPNLSDIINGTTTIGNKLPQFGRTLNFRLTVRDNRAACGGSIYTAQTVTVNGTAGPFVITSPNTTGIVYPVGVVRNVTWSVNSTDIAPINCPTVHLLLSTDGGATFTDTIATNVPNNGTFAWSVPNSPSTTCRIKAIATNNIFFDINDKNFEIRYFTPDFTLMTTDTVQRVCVTTTPTFNFTNEVLSNFGTSVDYTVSGLPANATGTFSPANASPTTPTTLTVGLDAATPVGTYLLTATATAGTVVRTKVVKLIVYSPAATPITLASPADAAGIVNPLPMFTWAANANAVTYTLEVATDTLFANIIITQNNITGTTFTPAASLIEGATYFWRVRAVNPCGANENSAIYSFTTGFNVCQTYVTADAPLVISSSSVPTVTMNIDVTDAFTVSDVNVKAVKVTHNNINHLSLRLRSPVPSTIDIMPRLCGAQAGLNSIGFDDAATLTPITVTCPPPANAKLKPTVALATFNNINSAGRWSLILRDNVTGTGGTFTSWSIELCRVQATAFVATSQENTTQKIVVYPNPTTDELNVLIANSNSQSLLKVMSVTGQLVATATATDFATISTANYPKGVYILQIQNSNGIATRKFVVE